MGGGKILCANNRRWLKVLLCECRYYEDEDLNDGEVMDVWVMDGFDRDIINELGDTKQLIYHCNYNFINHDKRGCYQCTNTSKRVYACWHS